MTSVPARQPVAAALRMALVLGISLLAPLAGEIAARRALARSPSEVEARLAARALQLQDAFRAVLDRDLDLAAKALAHGATPPSPAAFLASHLEGTGVARPDGTLLSWFGTPHDANRAGPGQAGPEWTIRAEGLRRRLVATTAPDAGGRRGVATLVLDSPVPERSFASLLPRGTDRSELRQVEFFPAGTPREDLDRLFASGDGIFRPGNPAGYSCALRSSTGDLLGRVILEEVPAAHRAARARSLGRAWGAVLLVTLGAFAFPWRRLCRRTWGLCLALAATAVSRAVLLAAAAPSLLLPRDLGSASLYGSSRFAGLLGSPADLALTGGALFLIAGALAIFFRQRFDSLQKGAAIMSLAAGAAASAMALGIAITLVTDGRLPVLRLRSVPESAAQILLLLGLGLTALGGAVLLATAWNLFRGGSGAAKRRSPSLTTVAVAAVPVVILAGLGLLRVEDAEDLERLRSEFAPQVLDQSARRWVAVEAAAREAAIALEERRAAAKQPPSWDTYTAYTLWVRGSLFHLGYRSSLDVYRPDGALVSHFGFDIPPLEESISSEAIPVGTRPVVSEEILDTPGLGPRHLIHADATVPGDEGPAAVVVTHVLDEPDNLPFLPRLRSYLGALGPEGRPKGEETVPGYALFDSDGNLELSTLTPPPAATPALFSAAAESRVLHVRAGADRYLALPLAEEGRLHLLLLPARTPLDRLGTFVRLALVLAALLLLLRLPSALIHPERLRRLAGGVRRSFSRKLLVTILAASLIPLVSMALVLRGYVERRGQASLLNSATELVGVAKRVVEDYAAIESSPEAPAPLDDGILQWLRRVVGQEIHVFVGGRLEATSRRELFSSGLLPMRVPGEVYRGLTQEHLPYLVRPRRLGESVIPVAYAPVRLPGPSRSDAILAVPLILAQQEVRRAVGRVEEMLLLATVLLAGLLAVAATWLARAVAGPVRELVDATGRVASGDYRARLQARTRDEVAELVRGFNAMAEALARQRADLERRRDYMEALLRNATTGVVSTDPEGRIVTLNPAAAEMLGSARRPLRVGEDLVESVRRTPDLASMAEALRKSSPAGGEPVEVDLERGGGQRRYRMVRLPLPDPEGGPPGRLYLVDDVTDLMRSNQLAAWAEMAQAIAHEIKNPLTPIQLSTEHLERLLKDRDVLPSPEIEACLTTVFKQVRDLREIAGEFSAYARLPALDLQEVDPGEFLREQMESYRAAQPPGIRIEEKYEPCPPVAMDRRTLSRAVVNLVENALEAMPGGGTLTVGVAPDERGAIVLWVRDTGTGLDPEARRRLFEPYFSTKLSGTGLGLAIVRRVVEMHRGTVEVRDVPEGGTEFRIQLPAA